MWVPWAKPVDPKEQVKKIHAFDIAATQNGNTMTTALKTHQKYYVRICSYGLVFTHA
jgi:hypothetical protein